MTEKRSVLMNWYLRYHALYKKGHKRCANFLYRLCMLLFNCSIPPSAEIDETVNFGHPIGIVIHQNTVVGKNTLIYQNVTLGRVGLDNQDAPIIGDNCIIGAGACILGKIRIGNNVKIGANAVVTKDIPDDCTAVGIPAKVVHKNAE